jgi:hypothetical protein
MRNVKQIVNPKHALKATTIIPPPPDIFFFLLQVVEATRGADVHSFGSLISVVSPSTNCTPLKKLKQHLYLFFP